MLLLLLLLAVSWSTTWCCQVTLQLASAAMRLPMIFRVFDTQLSEALRGCVHGRAIMLEPVFVCSIYAASPRTPSSLPIASMQQQLSQLADQLPSLYIALSLCQGEQHSGGHYDQPLRCCCCKCNCYRAQPGAVWRHCIFQRPP